MQTIPEEKRPAVSPEGRENNNGVQSSRIIAARPRSMGAEPFCWQSKFARREIRKQLPPKKHVSALAVYDALCEISSDENSSPFFRTTHEWIAAFCGLSIASVKRALEDLQGLGLIQKTGKKFKAPLTYALLAVCHGSHDGSHDGSPLANDSSQEATSECELVSESVRNIPHIVPQGGRHAAMGWVLPKDELEAVESAKLVHRLDPRFAIYLFREVMARDGKTAKGQPVGNWAEYLAAAWRNNRDAYARADIEYETARQLWEKSAEHYNRDGK